MDTLFMHGILTVGIAGMGMFILHSHDNTPRGRFISWLTAVLCVSGFVSAGLVMALFEWPPAKEYLACTVAGGGFGLLCGLAVGRFVWRYFQREIVGDEDTP